MSLFNALRQAIAGELATIPDIGVVHGRLRFAADTKSFQSLFTAEIDGQTQVRGWAITLERTGLEYEGFGDAGLMGPVTYTITGWLGLDDEAATEETLTALAEAVIRRLSGTDLGVAGAYPRILVPNITRFEHVMLGSRLCHRVTISCPVMVADSETWG